MFQFKSQHKFHKSCQGDSTLHTSSSESEWNLTYIKAGKEIGNKRHTIKEVKIDAERRRGKREN